MFVNHDEITGMAAPSAVMTVIMIVMRSAIMTEMTVSLCHFSLMHEFMQNHNYLKIEWELYDPCQERSQRVGHGNDVCCKQEA